MYFAWIQRPPQSGSDLWNYFLLPPPSKCPTLEPCWYPRNTSPEFQQPVPGLGHSLYTVPVRFCPLHQTPSRPQSPSSRRTCAKPGLISPALPVPPALPFSRPTSCSALCLEPSFPSSCPQCLLFGQTIPGHPFHLMTFSHQLLSSMVLGFFPSWPSTQSVISLLFSYHLSSQLDGRPHEIFCPVLWNIHCTQFTIFSLVIIRINILHIFPNYQMFIVFKYYTKKKKNSVHFLINNPEIVIPS